MIATGRRTILPGLRVAILVCAAAAGATWMEAGAAPAKKVQAKVVHADAQSPAREAVAPAGPGLAIGPNTNYAVQVPVISVETAGPLLCNVGKPMEQQILVKNIGTVAAELVEVRAAFSPEATVVSTEPQAEADGSAMVWRIPQLPAEGQQKITVQLKPLTEGELSCNTSVAFRSSSSLKVSVGQPKLKLVFEGPQDTVIGSDAHLMLNVTNIGTGTANAVKVAGEILTIIDAESGRANSAEPPAPHPVELGTLEPGESRFLNVVAPAQQAGTYRIDLRAHCEEGPKATTVHDLEVRAPQLSLSMAGPEFRYLDRKATYQLVLDNPGSATAMNVHLSVTVPGGLQFLDASDSGFYNEQKRTVEWVPGIIEAGQKQEFSLTVLAKTEGEHSPRAVAWADNNLQARAEKLTRAASAASIVLDIEDLDDLVEIGSVTAYEIHVTNRGTKAADGVQVVAFVPEGMQAVTATGPVKFRIEGPRVIFDELPTLGAQVPAAFRVEVKGTKAGTARFRAEVKSRSLHHAVTAEKVTEIYGE